MQISHSLSTLRYVNNCALLREPVESTEIPTVPIIIFVSNVTGSSDVGDVEQCRARPQRFSYA